MAEATSLAAKRRRRRQQAKKEAPPPSPRKLRQIMLGYDFMDCRLLRHSWPRLIDCRRVDVGNGLEELTAVCEKCGTERVDVRHRRGGILHSRTYRHPENFLLTGYKEILPTLDDWWEIELSPRRKVRVSA